MIVVTKQRRGWDGLGGHYPMSRTAIYPDAARRVSVAERAAGGWTQVRPLNGLGAITDSIPSWVLWGGAGLAIGGVAGYFLLGKKKRRRK